MQVLIFMMTSFLLIGCGSKRPKEIDVTRSPEYNFLSFTGTVWRTRIKVALADCKTYRNEPATILIPPEYFDATHPSYAPVPGYRIVAVLPVGTHVRVGQLMMDNGAWGGVRVTAAVKDGTNVEHAVYLAGLLLAGNKFIRPGDSVSTNWGVNPEMLEKADEVVAQPSEGSDGNSKPP